MRIAPRPLDIGDNDGFEGTDIFEYADFGERFANLVCNLDQSLTVVLDGPWGSGKSTFIKQWAGLLRNRGVPVIQFDAFANDHHEDAFTALAGEIVAVAREKLSGSSSRTKNLISSATKVSKAMMPLATRIGVRAATLGVISVDDMEDAGEAAKTLLKDAGNEAAKAAEKAVRERVTKARDERLELEGFRKQLAEMAGGLAEKAAKDAGDKQPRPLVFIVDELDRCRPPFAVNLLERVKHLFSVPGVVFVLVTNLDQMTKAIRGAYGPETDSHSYLEKFYDLRATLPMPQTQQGSTVRRYIDFLWNEMGLDSGDGQVDQMVREGLALLADHRKISLRTLDRIATHVALTYASSAPRTLKLAPLIVGLCAMRQMNPGLYELAQRGELSYADAVEFFSLKNWPAKEAKWYANWWRYFTDASVDESEKWFQEMGRSLVNYGVDDRFGLIQWATSRIDDLEIVGPDAFDRWATAKIDDLVVAAPEKSIPS